MYTYTDGQAQDVQMDMADPQPQRETQPNSHRDSRHRDTAGTETQQAQRHSRHRDT